MTGRRPPQVELQLQAMAAAADRANRPAAWLGVPILALAAAFLFGVIALRQYRDARAGLNAAQSEGVRIVGLINEIQKAESAGIDLERLFPVRQFFGSQIVACFEGDPESGVEPIAFNPAEKPTVGDPKSVQLGTAGGITRTEIACVVNNDSLDKIFQWIDQVLRHKFLKGKVFVSALRLTPGSPGWRAEITFTLYEMKSSTGSKA